MSTNETPNDPYGVEAALKSAASGEEGQQRQQQEQEISENASLVEMLSFMGTKESEVYHAINASVINQTINCSRLLRGNSLLGPKDSMMMNSIMRHYMHMKPVHGDLASFTGEHYNLRGSPGLAAAAQPARSEDQSKVSEFAKNPGDRIAARR